MCGFFIAVMKVTFLGFITLFHPVLNTIISLVLQQVIFFGEQLFIHFSIRLIHLLTPIIAINHFCELSNTFIANIDTNKTKQRYDPKE